MEKVQNKVPAPHPALLPAATAHLYCVPSFANPAGEYVVTFPTAWLKMTVLSLAFTTLSQYVVAALETLHWNVTEVPPTVEPLVGEIRLGTGGRPPPS